MNGAKKCHTQVYASDLGQMRALREFVRSVCQQAWPEPGDQTALDEIVLAVQEAATNIIRHAYGGRSDRDIHVEVTTSGDQVGISLFDHGKRFERTSAKPPATEGSQLGGWGIYLIEKLVDEVSYHRDDQGRNEIRMVRIRTDGSAMDEKRSPQGP